MYVVQISHSLEIHITNQATMIYSLNTMGQLCLTYNSRIPFAHQLRIATSINRYVARGPYPKRSIVQLTKNTIYKRWCLKLNHIKLLGPDALISVEEMPSEETMKFPKHRLTDHKG